MSSPRDQYESQGYLPRLTIMSPGQMRPYREAFDQMQAGIGAKASQVGLMNRHLQHQAVWELVNHPEVIQIATDLLGPDVLLLGSHFFSKLPDHRESFVAWHQDVTYWGLTPAKAMTVWLAIDDADVANGCMRVIPASHKQGILPHGTSDDQGNLLSVNQAIPPDLFDLSAAVDLPLPAGSASVHHGLTIHGSNPNRSDRRRCGLTIRFTTPDVAPDTRKPDAVKWNPILIAGEDRYHHFTLLPKPVFETPSAT